MYAGVGAGVLLAIGLLIFGVQQWQLSNLQNQWSKIEKPVREVEGFQQQIRRFRPWFDANFHNLSVMKALTEAFPEDGRVSAKSLEIHENGNVTCSGSARDNPSLFKIMDQLRSKREIENVKLDQIRGKSPLQFTFDFKWVEGGAQ